MEILPHTISDEEWIEHIFKHPLVDENEDVWYWCADAIEYDIDADPERAILRVIDVLNVPKRMIEAYTPEELGQGFHYLLSSPCSNYMHLLNDGRVDLSLRVECISSFDSLYRRCFAELCEPVLQAHSNSSAGASRLNSVCYMLWDTLPLWPDRNMEPTEGRSRGKRRLEEKAARATALYDTAMEVMEAALQIDHSACQVSALHGLGHWQRGYPKRVRATIGRFLSRSGLSDKLRAYALAAREGMVQ